MLINNYLGDILGVAVSFLLLMIYHGYLYMRLRRDPHYTVQSVNRVVRRAWVESIMKDDSKPILAVQTLRNSTMAATFLASTSVLLIIGVLTLSGQSEKIATTWHALNVYSTPHPGLWIIKILSLVIDFFIAFFSFAMSLRLFNHVGYQIAVPASLRPASLTPSKVAVHLNRAGGYYSIGMRAYYLSVPLVFWLFGPHFMFFATITIIAVLYHVDRAPKDE